MGIRVRLLGPTRVDGPAGNLPLGGPFPRALLAATALEASRPVPHERLVDLLWGHRPPGDERGSLHQTASRLRRALAAGGTGNVLRPAAPGYVLDLPPDSVDALVFRSTVRAAAQAARSGDAAGAVALLDDGLGRWDDRALIDLGSLPIAVLGDALDEERWRAEEQRASLLLDLRRADDAVGHLQDATAREPLRESLWVLLATALARLGRLDDATRTARTAVAVVTSELGVPPSPALAGLEARLVAETPVPGQRVRLLRPPFPPSRRPLLGEALERAVASAEHAARSAQARGAVDEAVRQWQRALDLAETATPDDGPRLLRLLLDLGGAHNLASSDAEGRAVFRRAAELARSLGDARGFAEAALGYCAQHISFSPPPEQAALLREALELLDDADEPLLRGRMLARLATEEYWFAPLEQTHALATEALAEARRSGDAGALLEARFAEAFGVWSPRTTEQMVQVARVHLEEARVAGDRLHEHRAHRWLATALVELGDFAGAGSHLAETLRLADELALAVEMWFARCVASSYTIALGDLAEAERLASDALVIGSTVEPTTSLDYVSLLIWNCRFLQGRLDEVSDLVEEVAGAPGVELPRRLGLAMTRAMLGRHEAARSQLDEITVAELEAMPVNGSWWPGMAALAETVGIVPHRHAAWGAERLAPFADRIGATQTTMTGPVSHHLALCQWAVGRREEALVSLEDAIRRADRLGMPVFAARSRLALAERLVVVGAPGSARHLAEEAADQAGRLGLIGVATAAEELIRTVVASTGHLARH